MRLKDTIESRDDWNLNILRGEGDTLPPHGFVTPVYQTMGTSRLAVGWNLLMIQEEIGITGFNWNTDVPCPDRSALYLNVSVNYGGSTGIKTWSVLPLANYNINGHPQSTPFDNTLGPVNVGDVSLTSPLTIEFVTGEADTIMNAQAWSGDVFDAAAQFYQYYKSCTTFGATPPDDVTNPTTYPSLVTVGKMRYKMVVPTDYKYPYLRTDWDEVFYPRKWLEWEPVKDEHDAWKEAHDAWKAAKPADRGPEPAEPAKPGTEPGRPRIIKSPSWVGGVKNKVSPWWTVLRPASEGIVVIRNLRCSSYRAKWGTKPTFYGDRWIP